MNEWNCPKEINNSFDEAIAEEYTGVRQTKECKRCGKVFKLLKVNQKFCCRDCSDKYHDKMEELKRIYGNDFKKWLGKSLREAYY